MVVQHNLQANNTNRMLGQNVKVVKKSSEKLASGYKINRAADDAAGLSISEKMRAQIRGLNQAVKNAEDGISLIQTAEGNMNEMHSILQRMEELAVKGANDVNESEDRQTIQDEMNQLDSELKAIASRAKFNGKALKNFTGFLQIGANKDDDMKITVKVKISLKSKDVKKHSTASKTISAVQKAIKDVSAQRSALGAVQNRLEYTVNNLENYSENLTDAESRIRDTDMATEMVNYSKSNIVQQAAQSMLAQANQSNQGVLSLLQ
ncbi:MAG: flagellin [Lachnospiraceae bacterium]|nr:flagellin [Lachnospiraceae bacterium]